jgi:queuosine precursor transporter
MLAVIIAWIIGITVFSLLGSWYARKFDKPDLLVVLYVTFVLAAQVLAAKISAFDLGFKTFFVPGGVLVFSVTFLLTDIVNERFGRKETQRMILLAFVSQVALVFFFWMGVRLPPAPFWTAQAAWGSIFGLVPRITLASWIAFLVSENFDALIFSWFRKWTGGRHLWARNIFSSVPALALDSLIFVPIAFAGLMPLGPLIVGQLALKWLTCVVDVPFMYLNRWLLMGAETGDMRRNV